MLNLREVGNREWEFIHPEGYNDTFALFDEGCDLFENGQYEKAEEIFRKVIEEIPDHLDAIHHVALACDLTGRKEEAVVLWEKVEFKAVSFLRRQETFRNPSKPFRIRT